LCFSGALLTVLVGILWFDPTLFATSSFLQSETALLNFLFVVILIIAFGFYYVKKRDRLLY